MRKATKAVILYSKLTKPRFPHVVIFYISENGELVELEANAVYLLDNKYKPQKFITICSFMNIGDRIVSCFPGENYDTELNIYSLDDPGFMIKFNAAVLMGQKLAYKAFKKKPYYSMKNGGYDSIVHDLMYNFIDSRFSVRYIANELEVRRLYKLDKAVLDLVEGEYQW